MSTFMSKRYFKLVNNVLFILVKVINPQIRNL